MAKRRSTLQEAVQRRKEAQEQAAAVAAQLRKEREERIQAERDERTPAGQ